MRYIIWTGIVLAMFGTGMYYTLHHLYHGNVSREYQETVIDTNLLDIEKEQLYPGSKTEILFGTGEFDNAYPGLSETRDLGKIFRESRNINRGFVVRKKNGEKSSYYYGVEIRRVYWSEKFFWQSHWFHLEPSDVVTKDVIGDQDAIVSGALMTPVEDAPRGEFWENSEYVFGRKILETLRRKISDYQDEFLEYETVSSLLYVSRLPVSRAWVIDGEKTIGRLYWNDRGFWFSDWHYSKNNEWYTGNGVLNEEQNSTWDHVAYQNWPQMTGILIGELFVLFFVWFVGIACIAGEGDYRHD